MIWDTAKNTITPYADGVLVCYSDGQIAYRTELRYEGRDVTVVKMKIGAIGKEVEVVSTRYGDQEPSLAVDINPVSCKSYASLGYANFEQLNLSNLHTNIVRLHEDHGYLDFYSTRAQRDWEKEPKAMRDWARKTLIMSNNYPIRYYRPGQPPLELNIIRGGSSQFFPGMPMHMCWIS